MRSSFATPLLVAALAVGCAGDDEPQAATSDAETTTEDPAVQEYCRVMERTEDDYRSGDILLRTPAEAERIRSAPPELREEYAEFSTEAGVPSEVIDRIRDWTEQHCGFLPTFDR